MRIIIYTGKGGVGKTSIAAATAYQMAAEGKRTIVISTDAAHSLSDSLGIPLQHEPILIHERLWAQEIDSLKETQRYWGSVRNWFSNFMQWANLDDIGSEELMVFPGFEELFSLLRIKEHAESGLYDAIIVDCAPTGETLRLLSYPQLLRWWVRNIFPYERKILKLARPIMKVTKGLELPSDDVMDSFSQVVDQLEKLQQVIADPEITSIRLVVNPEKMVISEARRAFTNLNLYGFHTDAVIVNKVLSEEASEGYFAQWKQIQNKYEEEIVQCFSPLPILKVPLMPLEVVGKEMLERVAAAAFHERECGAILHRGIIEEVKKTDTGYELRISLPFTEKKQLQLNQKGDELTLQVGSYRRIVALPRVLLGRQVEAARLADSILTIHFGPNEEL
ncbi:MULTISPECIES: ArsA family ATPase [unclassified Paenibacillus]|uniref:ArsA family ATPase n=1 Tax=unclassified Paenibacillus TaxID=185978 RepID=UPI00070AE1CA|nr:MULTISPECIES: ArsA family ATPase [unclassified Paenibacillus]KQX69023.1 arsenic-transporting ATPase [Paenibacillus sp. Root444D2]KRE48054.1 arsenic-transporting ATPase [Paenibacillus sp. Soil724D2]